MRLLTTAQILLFLYVISAIVFWGISLEKKSQTIYELEYQHLKTNVDSVHSKAKYQKELAAIKDKRATRTKQYIGEGATFLIIIFIGAAIVYTSFKRNIRLSRQQNNFMLSVTHELKSPIAAMKLNLQTMGRHNLDDEKKSLLINRCVSEANRLNDLCNNLLLASQMDGRQYKSTTEQLNFTELVVDCINDYEETYPNRLTVQDLDVYHLIGDKTLLQMAINNLLENAIKYTPVDKPIIIGLEEKNKHVILQVADNGTGIPDDEKNKIFNKFYRVGNEETRKAKGTGLGLYLTAKIVKQHSGKIMVKDNTPEGAIFEMCFPLS